MYRNPSSSLCSSYTCPMLALETQKKKAKCIITNTLYIRHSEHRFGISRRNNPGRSCMDTQKTMVFGDLTRPRTCAE